MRSCLQGLVNRGFVPDSVIDVGAAQGAWTCIALEFWPKARYFLIEPLEERRPDLEALRTAVPSVDFLIAGAGEHKTTLELGIDPAHLDGSSFAYTRLQSRTVDVVPLDDLLEEGRFRPPQFLKLDVQGFELDVLRGAAHTMAACGLILLEAAFFRFQSRMALFHEIVEWMAAHGFVIYEVVDVLRRPLDGAMGQCDLLFAREDHRLRANRDWCRFD
jgi:FkbM family methyltransferase